ncbi:MAG: hypothetical protein WCF85_12830 [Rhodospirillaceae bacterium]
MKQKISTAAAEALRQLDIHINPIWQLGRNAILAWTPVKTGIKLLVTPVRDLLRHLSSEPDLLHGSRYADDRRFAELCASTGTEPIEIITSLRVGSQDDTVPWQTIEGVIRRYSISETPYRAVMLFDIVGFSKLTSIQQIGQLNSLEYCINSAHQNLQNWGMRVELARSTTGDGFYVWTRGLGPIAEMSLLVLLVMALAENELERSHDRHGLVPLLRAAFSVGRHYAYYQIEGLSPRGYDYIVGDVTISLARLMTKIAPGQILIGDFERPVREGAAETISTPAFIAQAEKYLRKLVGREFNGHPMTDIALGLTGTREKGLDKYSIGDKHGLEHPAYNAVARLYRGGRVPVMLGLSSNDAKPPGPNPTSAE